MITFLAKTVFLWLSFTFCVQAQQRWSGSMSFQNDFYQYAATQDQKKWNVEVFYVPSQQKTAEKLSHRVFGTDMYAELANGKVQSIRIHAAVLLGYSWVVSPYEYLEVGFNYTTQKITYQNKGGRMSGNNINTVAAKEIVKTFVASKLTPNAAFNIAMQYFIKQSNLLFELPNKSRPVQKIIVGEVDVRGIAYSFELTRDFYSVGEDNLMIRREGRGLLSNTLLQMKTEGTTTHIQIHYAESKGLSWAIYASDYMKASFDTQTNTITYSKAGQTIPAPNNNAVIEKFNPSTDSADKLTEIAIRAFMIRYTKSFDRQP